MRPPFRIAASAGSRLSPWTSTSAASSPPGAKSRAVRATSSRFPSAAASAPSFRTSSTPSRPDATARTLAPIRFASCTARCPIPPLAPYTISVCPAREVQLIVEAAQRGHAVRAERARCLDAQPVRDGRDRVLVERDVLRVEPALEGVGVDAIADVKAPHAVAQGDHLARSVVADDAREPARTELDLAGPDVRIPDADPGGVQPDEDLVPAPVVAPGASRCAGLRALRTGRRPPPSSAQGWTLPWPLLSRSMQAINAAARRCTLRVTHRLDEGREGQ